MSKRYIVIMAGGRGERFWPASRLKRPKQLLPIVGEVPMLRQTVDRLGDLVPPERVFIITNAEQVDAVREVCDHLPPENIIGEPVGRDTAAAVGLAWLLVKRNDPEAVFAMLPADHVIHQADGFRRVLQAALAAAEREPLLLTIGIRPEHPATGYGYIQVGTVLFEVEGMPVHRVRAFREKPDAETARSYLESGGYYWNAGMFVWSTQAIGEALAKHAPELHTALEAMESELEGGKNLEEAMAKHYPALVKVSIDYAIMEKASEVAMIESDFDWDDVGEWPAVARHERMDGDGNTVKGLVKLQDSAGNIVIGRRDHLVAMLGCQDLIVVSTGDATLVCHRDQAQRLKEMVRDIGADHPELM